MKLITKQEPALYYQDGDFECRLSTFRSYLFSLACQPAGGATVHSIGTYLKEKEKFIGDYFVSKGLATFEGSNGKFYYYEPTEKTIPFIEKEFTPLFSET